MKYNTNTKIIEYSVVCKSKINAQQVNITAFKLIDNFPTENPCLVLDKHTPAISIPPALPLPLRASPTPTPHIIAPKIQLDNISGMIGCVKLGKKDNVIVCTTTLIPVLTQNSLFKILYPIINNGILIIKLMIPTMFIDLGIGRSFLTKTSIICDVPITPPKFKPLGVTNNQIPKDNKILPAMTSPYFYRFSLIASLFHIITYEY